MSSEPKTHDFTRSGWGHAQYMKRHPDDPTRYRGLVISTPIVREGDFIEWETEYGRVRLLVERTRFVRDPDDMTDVTSAVIVTRLGKSGEVLWSRVAEEMHRG